AYHRKQRGWGMALDTCRRTLHRLIEDGHPDPEGALRKAVDLEILPVRGQGWREQYECAIEDALRELVVERPALARKRNRAPGLTREQAIELHRLHGSYRKAAKHSDWTASYIQRKATESAGD
ncbi:MAG: hypothetical protein M3O78_07470, partial [Chloroflexota bacterium]|nr:hypothetical protein [Chloroflexota bacterium]